MDLVRILVVEDDKEIATLIQNQLSREGYQVDVVYHGTDALDQVKRQAYSLIILDLMLPGMDGFEVLRQLRQDQQMPVLILSAKMEQTDKILGLGWGADDYLTKPFQMSELLARVKAQLRRYLYMKPVEKEAILCHRDLELNRDTCEVSIKGKTVELTLKEFRILELLMEHPNRVYSKSQIFRLVWGEDLFVVDSKQSV